MEIETIWPMDLVFMSTNDNQSMIDHRLRRQVKSGCVKTHVQCGYNTANIDLE